MAQKHNQQAAKMWGHGGSAYDFISFGISDALAHATQRMWPEPGEKILDVATGTGWSARNLASLGARVTGIDIADDLLEAARALSAHIDPEISYQHADAEALPFDDASFDGVVSTFGVMFAPNQEQAASELARVCRPGGRLVLTTQLSFLRSSGSIAVRRRQKFRHSTGEFQNELKLCWASTSISNAT